MPAVTTMTILRSNDRRRRVRRDDDRRAMGQVDITTDSLT
jgi:hypothetical protein